MQDEKVVGKFDPADKEKLQKVIDEAIQWLDASQEASKEEYEAKQKELEEVANPIMMKMYQAAGGDAAGGGGFPGAGGFPGGAGFPGAAPGGFPASDDTGPSIEEVD